MKLILEWDWKKQGLIMIKFFVKYYFLLLLTVILLKLVFGRPISENPTLKPSDTSTTPFSRIESFENSASFNSVSQQEARLFLLEDSDNYVQSMSKSDLHARKVTCQEAYRLKGYYDVLEPSSEQISILQEACRQADAFFASYIVPEVRANQNIYIENLNIIGYFDAEKAKKLVWNIVLMKDDYEEGLPHTRDKYIFIHPSLLKRSTKELVSTLIHEKVHIYQRKYAKEETYIKPEERNGKLTDYMVSKMGFKRSKKRSDISCDIRANPDLDEWIYINPKNNREMYLCYRSGNPTGINDIIGDSKEEHPFEYIAYEIAKLYDNKTKN